MLLMQDLSDYLDDSVDIPNIPSLAFPDGKTYRFASPDAKRGLRLTALYYMVLRIQAGADVTAQVQALGLDEDWQADINREVLGDTLDEMVADGVSFVRLRRLVAYLFRYFVTGESAVPVAALGESTAPASQSAGAVTSSPSTPQGSPAGSTSPKRRKAPTKG